MTPSQQILKTEEQIMSMKKKMYNFLGYSQNLHFQNINCRWGDSNVQVMASLNFKKFSQRQKDYL